MAPFEHNKIYIIENTEKAIDEFSDYAWGGDTVTPVTEEHITALRSGKLLAFSDGEYTHFLALTCANT